MELLDKTLPSAQDNIALDDALLEQAEAAGRPRETIRLWEASDPVVVVGRSSRVDQEVDRIACRQQQVPIIRRCSGGAAIVTGPGCLMYAVVLSYQLRPELRFLDRCHGFVLGQMKAALDRIVQGVRIRGTSDLAIGNRKFSGNSIRCRRDHLLYHGTLLYDFPLPLVARYLKQPPRQPAYREDRDHLGFVTNLPVSAEELRRAVVAQWDPLEVAADWPQPLARRLVAEKYACDDWNFRHV